MRYLFILLFCLPLLGWSQTETLTIEFRDLESTDGNLMFRISNAAGDTIKEKLLPIKSLKQNYKINLKPGRYAVAVYHDENSNRKLDRAFTGIPTEEYGFSNDARGLISAPDLKDQLFKHQKNTLIRIHLK